MILRFLNALIYLTWKKKEAMVLPTGDKKTETILASEEEVSSSKEVQISTEEVIKIEAITIPGEIKTKEEATQVVTKRRATTTSNRTVTQEKTGEAKATAMTINKRDLKPEVRTNMVVVRWDSLATLKTTDQSNRLRLAMHQ